MIDFILHPITTINRIVGARLYDRWPALIPLRGAPDSETPTVDQTTDSDRFPWHDSINATWPQEQPPRWARRLFRKVTVGEGEYAGTPTQIKLRRITPTLHYGERDYQKKIDWPAPPAVIERPMVANVIGPPLSRWTPPNTEETAGESMERARWYSVLDDTQFNAVPNPRTHNIYTGTPTRRRYYRHMYRTANEATSPFVRRTNNVHARAREAAEIETIDHIKRTDTRMQSPPDKRQVPAEPWSLDVEHRAAELRRQWGAPK